MTSNRSHDPRTASDGPRFDHPLATRYASPDMVRIWSPPHRYGVWRRIWVALAEAQHALKCGVSRKQLDALRRAAAEPIDFDAVARYEAQTRHDVMAHIHAFGDAAPEARGVIHLGATSMDIVDNADLILMREALALLLGRITAAMRALAGFCERWAELPALGYTHLQPAQLTTVGKRGALWLYELVRDAERLESLLAGLRCRGIRGATGTQASFLKLLQTPGRVNELEIAFAKSLGFSAVYPVTGQTYSRKIDIEIIDALSAFAAGVHRICNDIRLLAMHKEIEEPFELTQVGSSAMPYKRNPARSERATGLARYLISLASSPMMTLAAQMLERTLDDSANKRLVMPEAFLTADALAVLLLNIFDGLVVNEAVIQAHIQQELPFIVSEEILLEACARGGDRQALHERLRQHSHLAGAQVKSGLPNDLLDRLRADPEFSQIDFDRLLDPRRHTGLAAEQTRQFLEQDVRPLLDRLVKFPAPAHAIRV